MRARLLITEQEAGAERARRSVDGVVRPILLRHGWLKSCLGVVVGTVAAVPGTPLVSAIVDHYGHAYLPDPQIDNIAAALLGITGMAIVEAILARIKGMSVAK